MNKIKVYLQQVEADLKECLIHVVMMTSKLNLECFKILMDGSTMDDYNFELVIKRKYNKK